MKPIDLDKAADLAQTLIAGMQAIYDEATGDRPDFGRIADLVYGAREEIAGFDHDPTPTTHKNTGISRGSIAITVEPLVPILGRYVYLVRNKERDEEVLRDYTQKLINMIANTLDMLLASSTIQNALEYGRDEEGRACR